MTPKTKDHLITIGILVGCGVTMGLAIFGFIVVLRGLVEVIRSIIN